MTFPAQAMQIMVELQVGAGGTWVAVTEDLRMANGVTITRGRQDEASEVNPGQCTIVLNNRHGKYSEFNPQGPYYGRLTKNTPIRVSVAPFGDGVYYRRFAGEVSKWPPRWDISDTDVWVPIEAAGILRRLRAGSDRPLSAHQRYIEAHSPLAYWPLTDGTDAVEGKPVVGDRKFRAIGTDGGALFQNQPKWGEGEIGQWMDNVILFPKEHEVVVGLPVIPSGVEWSLEWVQTGRSTAFSGWVINTPIDTQPEATVEIQCVTESGLSQFFVSYTANPFPTSVIDTGVLPQYLDPGPHLFRVTFTPTSATAYTCTAYLDGKVVDTGSESGIAPPVPVGLRILAEPTDPDLDSSEGTLVMGHAVIYGPNRPDADLSYKAMMGYRNEKAGRRIERLCQERGIGLEVQGDLDLTATCGPQQMQQVMDLLQSAADVDGGTLGESIEDLALYFRTQRSRYNQGEVL